MLSPKRVKHRKTFRGRMKGKALRGSTITYGEFGLQAQGPCHITANQIEAARIAMTRYTKRGGKVWIKIFPDKPITKKPAETRMGKGKGAPEYWVAVVKPGRIMFEIAGVSEEVAREALRLAMHKLPVKCKFIKKADQDAEKAKLEKEEKKRQEAVNKELAKAKEDAKKIAEAPKVVKKEVVKEEKPVAKKAPAKKTTTTAKKPATTKKTTTSAKKAPAKKTATKEEGEAK